MDTDLLARQIVADVLLLRGPDPNGGPGYMVSTEPELFMSHERLTLARRYAALVPGGTTMADVARIASAIAPHLHGAA